MNRLVGLAAFGALMLGATPVIAQRVPLETAADAVTSDLALCSAFYEAELTCFADALDISSRNNLETERSLANTYGVLLGKRAGLSSRELTARFEIAKRSVGDIIGHSCDGLPLISDQYTKTCTSLVQNPVGRFNDVSSGRVTNGLTQDQ